MPTVTRRDLDLSLQPGGIQSLYQPIVDLASGQVVGYEALARGPEGALAAPLTLLTAAREERRLGEVDWACRVAAFRGALQADLQPPLRLFINAEPEVVAAPCAIDLLPIFAAAHRNLAVVVELTERRLLRHPAALMRAVSTLRELAWGIAIDDVGADPDSLALLGILQPDVVKLDAAILQRSDASRAVSQTVRRYADATGADVVAEGIETPEHVETALSLGAGLGQGYLLGRPGPLPLATAEASAGAVATPARTPPPAAQHWLATRETAMASRRLVAHAGDGPCLFQLAARLAGARPTGVAGLGAELRMMIAHDTEDARLLVLGTLPRSVAAIPGPRRPVELTPLNGTSCGTGELVVADLSSHGASVLVGRPAGRDWLVCGPLYGTDAVVVVQALLSTVERLRGSLA